MTVMTGYLLRVCLILIITNNVSCSRVGRKMGRSKHMFWFKVSESERAFCDNVDEAEVSSIVEGPPATGCREDSERFCMCGKLGPVTRRNWTFFCGRCKKNEPFSFKVDLGRFKNKKNKKRRKNKNSTKNTVMN